MVTGEEEAEAVGGMNTVILNKLLDSSLALTIDLRWLVSLLIIGAILRGMVVELKK